MVESFKLREQSTAAVQAGGKPVICSHCRRDGFQRYGLVGATFAGYGRECVQCGPLEYFTKNPTEIEDTA
jgi:hypothetical protein